MSEYSLYYSSLVLSRILERTINAKFAALPVKSGLSPYQLHLLNKIGGFKPCNLTDMSEHVHLDRTTLFRNTQVLKEMDLISLGENANDSRQKIISITKRCRDLLDRELIKLEEVEAEVHGMISLSSEIGVADLIEDIEFIIRNAKGDRYR